MENTDEFIDACRENDDEKWFIMAETSENTSEKEYRNIAFVIHIVQLFTSKYLCFSLMCWSY